MLVAWSLLTIGAAAQSKPYKPKNGLRNWKAILLGGAFRVTTAIPLHGNFSKYSRVEIARTQSVIGPDVPQPFLEQITAKLKRYGVIVEEVMLRDIVLPTDYAKGLEGLIEKEQEDESLIVQTAIEKKQVQIAQYQAEAEKVRTVKQAEAGAQVRVLQAKAESDAMQYTLPLKEKQIQQTKLEAEARKQATIQNAEAEAQAKVIDSRAEQEKQQLLASAEANRIRVVAAADKERLQGEALVLKQNPLLINKIVAEKLSDRIQVMMVPADGKFFFANDVLKAPAQQIFRQEDQAVDPPARPQGGPGGGR